MISLALRLRRSRGLSLVELMVALAVGLLLMAGAISIFLSNKRTYQVTEDLSRLQENARFALDTMMRDLRMAGNVGCGNNLDAVNNIAIDTATDPRGVLWDLGLPGAGAETGVGLEGINNVVIGTSTWSPSNDALLTLPAAIVAGTDAVTVRYLAGPGRRVTADSAGTAITVETPPGVMAGELAGVVDCASGVLFQVAAASGSSITAADSLTRSFEAAPVNQPYPSVAPFRAARYYIGTGTVGGNSRSLYRQTMRWQDTNGNGTPDAGEFVVADDELVEGVEDLQVLYGIDTNGDERPDSYVTAGSGNLDSAAEWRRVVSLRLGLLLRTVAEFGTETDGRAYDLFSGQAFANLGACGGAPGCVDPPDLRVRRRVFSSTVFLRNRT
jgi:type IV pilus assembly protein PilW